MIVLSSSGENILWLIARRRASLMQSLYLGETGVGEHANLAGDVVPLARSANLFQGCMQLFSHGDDSVCHALQLNLQHSTST